MPMGEVLGSEMSTIPAVLLHYHEDHRVELLDGVESIEPQVVVQEERCEDEKESSVIQSGCHQVCSPLLSDDGDVCVDCPDVSCAAESCVTADELKYLEVPQTELIIRMIIPEIPSDVTAHSQHMSRTFRHRLASSHFITYLTVFTFEGKSCRVPIHL